MVKRGEVWLAALDPTVGCEIRKTRPCLVVSPPEIHDHLRTAIVAPNDNRQPPCTIPPRGQLSGQGGKDRPGTDALP